MTTLILQHKGAGFSLAQKLSAATAMLQCWMDKYHQRRQLAALESEQLEDLGLSVSMVEQEVSKPFWK